MIHDLPKTAGLSGMCLELRYSGFTRIVEVHTVGELTTGYRGMRVWQVSGGSVSGESPGWKLMHVDKAFTMHLTEQRSQAPRNGYRRGDSAFSRIDWQV